MEGPERLLAPCVKAHQFLVFTVPSLRNRILPAVRETIAELKGSLTDPGRASKLFGGILARKLLFALALGATAAAYGQGQSFATLVFINTAATARQALVIRLAGKDVITSTSRATSTAIGN